MCHIAHHWPYYEYLLNHSILIFQIIKNQKSVALVKGKDKVLEKVFKIIRCEIFWKTKRFCTYDYFNFLIDFDLYISF